jgi:hypothetical protein
MASRLHRSSCGAASRRAPERRAAGTRAPGALEAQVRRMVADERSQALVENSPTSGSSSNEGLPTC